MNNKIIILTLILLPSFGFANKDENNSDEIKNQNYLRSYNELIFDFNLKFHEVIGEDVVNLYNKTPVFLRNRISDFFNNLYRPISAINNFLQFKFIEGIDDITSFYINLFFGFNGLIDIAQSTGIPNHKEDFGQTLYFYGWYDSTVIVLPFFGITTTRDLIGTSVDLNINSKVNEDNESSFAVFLTKSFIVYSESAKYFNQLDNVPNKYIFSKELYLQNMKNKSLGVDLTEQTDDFDFE